MAIDFGVDFTPLGKLGEVYRQAQQRQARDQVLSQMGQGAGPLDYNTAARSLLAAGDTEGGLSLAKLAQQQYLTSPEYITAAKTAEARVAEQFAPKTTNLKLPGTGEEVTVEKGPQGYRVPTVQGLPQPDPNAPQPPPGVDAKKWRETRAAQLGNIDDKAVLEADRAVQTGSSAVESLNKALTLSKTANWGPAGSDKASYIGSLFGHQGSVNARELNNVVTNQALENLRATFGGNPTEGERKILLEVQGAATESPEVRERIYNNAIKAAQERIEFNKRNAEQMRGGKFLLPEAQRNAPQRADPNAWKSKDAITAARADPQGTLAQARKAIEGGADRNVVIQRLQAAGIDPRALVPFTE